MTDSLPIPTMDFDPVAFKLATGMFNDDERWKYIECLSHYWSQTHVQGIKDDDAGMRQLCNCDLSKWARLKGMIFDNDQFFFLENGKWHQKRARANYLKKQEDLIKRQAQTSIARTERTAQSVTKSNTKSGDFLGELSESPAYTGIDVKREFEKAKVWISLPQNKGRILSQRFFINWLNKIDRPLNTDDNKPAREAGVPSLSEVKVYAKEKWGTEQDWQNWAISFYGYWNDQKRNWKKKDGRQIDWKVELSNQVNKWRA